MKSKMTPSKTVALPASPIIQMLKASHDAGVAEEPEGISGRGNI